MADVADNQLNALQQQNVPEPLKCETNSVSAEEEDKAEKAGALESKHEEVKTLTDNADDSDKSTNDKLDELSSLEQEIAKMHNIQHCTDSDQLEMEAQVKDAEGGTPENGGSGNNDSQIIDELSQTTRSASVNKVHAKEETESEATLEDVDLIALLKGTDQDQDLPVSTPAAATDEEKSSIELALAELDNVGVTIEGEGQYEIMEIDDDNASGPSPVLHVTGTTTKTNSKSQGKAKLSPEQARAVALEQMADLKAHTARRKEAAASRQQQQQQQQPLDIISSLNDDWNEYDSSSDNTSNSNTNSIATTTTTVATKKPLAKKSKAVAESQLTNNVRVLVKSINQPTAPATVKNNAEPTGFKRTRVIKRKIIWDPDVPETQKSFAQYASTKITTTTTTASPTTTSTKTTETTTGSTKGNTTNVEATKKARPSTPKEPHKVAAKRAATPSKLVESNVNAATPKRRSQTPSVPNGAAAGVAKKKKVSEIDRLMGDEGAANMMQAVEREQRELSGGELPNKPLMRKRSLTLTGRQPQKTAASGSEAVPASPKKETPPKAKRTATTTTTTANNNAAAVDAVFTKTPKSQAADSWDYVYKQRASEESMIMRRRSNSSYSSNASVNRLSLDNKPAAVANLSDDASDAPANDPSFKFLKPETKANQRSDGSTPQTLANDLKRGAQQQKESRTAAKVELITLHKLEKVTQLIINTQLSKTGHTYKLQLLQKLIEMLNKLAKSNDCNTVLLSVQGQQFCQGIECQELIAPTLEKRKSNANQLALVLKTYLRTLATFPKPLVAGVVGNLMNLGVMQLPLLDYVVASEDCTFETSYAKLGQLPEGYALWHKHPKVSSQVHSRLFLLGERLQTSEIVQLSNSFIDKSCKANSVLDEALAAAQLISSTTAEHFRSLKKLNHTANTPSLHRLDAEFKILTEQWSTANFQANYKRYVSDLNI